jgi:hypothetical protein
MTRKTRMERKEGESGSEPDGREQKRSQRRVPSRYDILIQCRDEAEQRELFERLQGMELNLRLLVL